MGHAPVGKTPIEDQSHTLDEKINIILAIDRIGFTELRIQDENLDAEGWNAYLEEDLLPVCGPRRTFMMDNLMEAQLRGMQYIITKQNFHRCIIAAFRAATTPANRRAVFGHCGSNFGL